jgi:hypothetical protein
MRAGPGCGLALLLAAALVRAQSAPELALPAKAPVLRGALVECDGHAQAGEFSIRGPESEVVRYRFDAKTRVERAGMAATLTLFSAGEPLEATSVAIPDSPLRYATAVVALNPTAPPHILHMPQTHVPLTQALPLFSKGDLTFSGVVSYLADGRLVLRTRNAGDQVILLRKDTRFLAAGDLVKVSDLKANMRVFVRAGKDLFGRTEAYQVMWGAFLQPREQ